MYRIKDQDIEKNVAYIENVNKYYRGNVQNSSNPNYITWYYGKIKLKFLVILIGYIYCTAGIFFAKTNNFCQN